MTKLKNSICDKTQIMTTQNSSNIDSSDSSNTDSSVGTNSDSSMSDISDNSSSDSSSSDTSKTDEISQGSFSRSRDVFFGSYD